MPVLRDLSLASRQCFEELAAEPGVDFGLQKRGLLMLCKEQHTLDEEAATAEQARQLGIPADVVDARGLAALEPGVTFDVTGAVYFPQDCHLDPGRLMHRLQQQLLERGAEFRWDTELTGWRTESGRLMAAETTNGAVEGDEYVICGGSWSPGIIRGLNLSLPLQPGKGYSLTLPNPPRKLSICSILTEARVAVTPMGDSLRIGGTMEIAGLNDRINSRRVAGITKALPDYYPDFAGADFATVKPWFGLRPCSPDGLPYLGRASAYEKLTIATGHAMMGLSLGPITGKVVAALLSDETPNIDLGLLSPDRYA
jgi:D-amino-acid dehydrogenase